MELGLSSLKTSSSSLSCHEATGQISSSGRVYDQTLKRVLAKTAFSLPYVKFSFHFKPSKCEIEAFSFAFAC